MRGCGNFAPFAPPKGRALAVLPLRDCRTGNGATVRGAAGVVLAGSSAGTGRALGGMATKFMRHGKGCGAVGMIALRDGKPWSVNVTPDGNGGHAVTDWRFALRSGTACGECNRILAATTKERV